MKDSFVFKGDYVVAKAMRANDWANAVGRSLYLSAFTGRKPGVVLVTQPNATELRQAKMACDRGGIKLWTVTVD